MQSSRIPPGVEVREKKKKKTEKPQPTHTAHEKHSHKQILGVVCKDVL